MTNNSDTGIDKTQSSLAEAQHTNDPMPQTEINSPTPPRKRKRKSNGRKPLDLPEDEAIAQYLATPKSIREFKTFADLAAHFMISRMTVYRRSKSLEVLRRAEWLMTHHKLAGDLLARRSWELIVAAQVKAAIAGNVTAARFCELQAWPQAQDADPFSVFRK